jgi:RIO-like serine/threonine protein kinase
MLLKASFCDMAETEAEYILLALMDAYNAGFLHRDFSPGNIIMGVDGKGLLIDWDLCKPLSGDSGNVRTPRRATRTVRDNYKICILIPIPTNTGF